MPQRVSLDLVDGIDAKFPVIGTYNVAELPPAQDYQGKYAFVPDLGGGADMVISDGDAWKHIRKGKPGTLPVATTVNVFPLLTAPQIIMSGNGFNSTANLKIASQNLYQGYELTVVIPSGVLGLAGSFGVGLGSGGLLSMLGGTWADYSYDGSQLVKLRGGNV